MLFKRNGTAKQGPKRSLMERLVIVDANDVDPEEVAEAAAEVAGGENEAPEIGVVSFRAPRGEIHNELISSESQEGRRRKSFNPRMSFDAGSANLHTISEQELEDAVAQAIDREAQKIGVKHFEEPAVSEDDDFEPRITVSDPSEFAAPYEEPAELRREEPEPAAEAYVIPIAEESRPIETDETETYEERPISIPIGKTFDILDRAKERPDEDERIIKIVYRAPKVVSGLYAQPESKRQPLVFSEAMSPIAEEESAQAEESVESLIDAAIAREAEDALAEAEEPAAEAPVGRPDNLQDDAEIVARVLDENTSPITHEEAKAAENDTAPASWVSSVEEAAMPKISHFDKVLFPEEYFYASNGDTIKTARQLYDALGNMDDATFAHHAIARNTNDFANWIKYVYGHEDVARQLMTARERTHMRQILEDYL
ncbi:MAG TPA: hypothetical protein VHF05_00450 [Candidatus Paceibacterota bacterium]|nr:hypothetical protein [Candidatus Paceibacterota bacterium]